MYILNTVSVAFQHISNFDIEIGFAFASNGVISPTHTNVDYLLAVKPQAKQRFEINMTDI